MNTTTTTALRFNITQTRSGLFYSPANESAQAVIPKGRKCLKMHELSDMVESGSKVELNISGYLGKRCWVALTIVA
jgi:hypothetical protein